MFYTSYSSDLKLAVNTIKDYVTAIQYKNALVQGYISLEPMLKRWIKGLEHSKGIPVWLELVLAYLKGPIQTHQGPPDQLHDLENVKVPRTVAVVPLMDCVQLVVDSSLTLIRRPIDLHLS